MVAWRGGKGQGAAMHQCRPGGPLWLGQSLARGLRLVRRAGGGRDVATGSGLRDRALFGGAGRARSQGGRRGPCSARRCRGMRLAGLWWLDARISSRSAGWR